LDKTRVFEKLVTNDDGTKFQGIKQTIIDGKVSYIVSADFVKTGILTSSNFVWNDKEKKGAMWDLDHGIFLSPNLQIDENGNVTVNGNITATSLTLVDGLKIPKENLEVPTKITDLIGGSDILYENDVSTSTNTVNGIQVTTITFGNTTFQTLKTPEGVVYTNVGYGEVSEDKTKPYACISSDGLLEANNAIISGEIFANAGQIGGFSLKNGALNATNNMLMFDPTEGADTLFQVDAQANN
jgi:hypothetical protein